MGYNPVFYTTTEGQGSVVLNITIFDPPAGGTTRPFTLVVNTQDGTASMFKREVRDIKGAAPARATLIFNVFGDLPEKTYGQNGGQSQSSRGTHHYHTL